MSYKTEMHCHTKESSKCGQASVKEAIDAYVASGYTTLVITDHYGGIHVEENGVDVDAFLCGYKTAKEYAGDRINIIQGMELRFPGSSNDYLVYGITEDILRRNPYIYKLSLAEFYEFAHENGMLIYQAHPFRNNMVVVNPDYLDGVEVYNAHPRQNSRNSIAQMWAKIHKKKMISGSDAHRAGDFARGGILTEEPIRNSEDLLKVLESEKYELIIQEK